MPDQSLDNPSLSALFQPLTLAGKTLRNRACLTATLTNYGTGNRVTEKWQNFLIERAAGGTGMLITEGIAVDPNAVAHAAVIKGFDDANDDGFIETAKQVHAHGSLIVAQLWHAGRQQLWAPTHSPQGVSEQPDAYSWSVPHVMDDDEIHRVIDSYVEVAARFHHCGFDGVELHGAHGYLITQFMSPWSNTRNDQWGGSRENRLRFAIEIAGRIRQRCGENFIIGIKLSGDEGVSGGIDPAESKAITQALSDSGLFDYFAYSQGNFSISLENHVPDMHFDAGHFLSIAAGMRDAANGVPIMALGRVTDAVHANTILDNQQADLIGVLQSSAVDRPVWRLPGWRRLAATVSRSKAPAVFRVAACIWSHCCQAIMRSQNSSTTSFSFVRAVRSM